MPVFCTRVQIVVVMVKYDTKVKLDGDPEAAGAFQQWKERNGFSSGKREMVSVTGMKYIIYYICSIVMSR